MEVRILGPLEVRDDSGQPLVVRGGRQRTLIALLALSAGKVTPAERLIDDLWGAHAPQQPGNALQIVVFKLRRALGAERIETRPPGYALMVAEGDVDAHRFERFVREGRAALGAGSAAGAVECFERALGEWRGAALAEFGDVQTAVAAASRLEELRAATAEDRFEALLALGRDAELVPDLDAAIAATPYRERLRGQLMLALYRSGRQADALRAFRDARHMLAEELGLEPGSELRRLEAAILGQDPSLDLPVTARAAAAEPSPATPTNLRPALTSFVGREHDMAGIEALLGAHRHVTLVGPGGCGKTRLATEVAGRHVPAFPGGVWLVPLDTLTSGDDVPVAAAAALGLSTADTAGQPSLAATGSVERLRNVLGERTALVVLDNCEHVIDEAARLTEDLLTAAPQLRVLATSREALRVPGEMVWSVPPLSADDAVSLFNERARGAGAHFELEEADRPALAELCARLDGMPLAIELTAVRVSAFTIGQLAERLDDRFRLLTGGARTALPRQQTLRAVTDWSYDLLFDDERTVFERLSAFAGGCTLEAAEAVCADDRIAVADVGDLVGRLVDKSLVVAERNRRYRLLLTLAQYGRERLAERPDGAAVRDRHADYFARLAEQSSGSVRAGRGGHNQEWWLAHLTEELDNIRAALAWSIGSSDGATAQRLTGRLGWYWWFAGRTAEGEQWLDQALACDRATPPPIRAPAVTWRAWLALDGGDPDVAAGLVADALELSAQTGDDHATRGLAWSLKSQLDQRAGRRDDAAADLDEAERAYLARGDAWGDGMAAGLRSRSAVLRDRPDVAEREAMAALDTFRELGDHCTLVLMLERLSQLLEASGRWEAAEVAVGEARDVSCAQGLRGWQSTLSTRLGSLALHRGDVARAAELHREAIELARELALPVAEAAALDNLGLVHRHNGELDDARRYHAAAHDIAVRSGADELVARTSIHLREVVGAPSALDDVRR